MKMTMKMIFAAALALTMIVSLGACAFADYGFWTPNGYCVDHENGIVTMYYHDGSTETVNNNTGSRTYGDYDGSSLTFYRNGDSVYQNGNGYSSYSDACGNGTDVYADGSYSVTEGDYIYHFDRFGNLTGVQVYNGSWYETVWSN
jgi:hypothetical protein